MRERLLFFGCFGKLHEICLDESVEVAVHYATYVRSLMAGAVILHATVIK